MSAVGGSGAGTETGHSPLSNSCICVNGDTILQAVREIL